MKKVFLLSFLLFIFIIKYGWTQNEALTDKAKSMTALKAMQGINDEAISSFLKDLYKKDPDAYKKIKELQQENPSQAEAIILQEMFYKKKGLTDKLGISPLESFVLKQTIREESKKYQQATSASLKAEIKERVRDLVEQSFDNHVASLDKQIEVIEHSLQTIKDTKLEYQRSREEKIKKRVSRYLDTP